MFWFEPMDIIWFLECTKQAVNNLDLYFSNYTNLGENTENYKEEKYQKVIVFWYYPGQKNFHILPNLFSFLINCSSKEIIIIIIKPQ